MLGKKIRNHRKKYLIFIDFKVIRNSIRFFPPCFKFKIPGIGIALFPYFSKLKFDELILISILTKIDAH